MTVKPTRYQKRHTKTRGLSVCKALAAVLFIRHTDTRRRHSGPEEKNLIYRRQKSKRPGVILLYVRLMVF